MQITKEEFIEIFETYYPEKLNDRIVDIMYGIPTKDNIKEKLKSKLWCINNVYHITNVEGDRVIFQMNKPQLITYLLKLKYIRLIIVKSRQLGISTLFLIDYFHDLLNKPYLTVGMMAQDRPTSMKLFEKVKLTWDNNQLKTILGVESIRDNTTDLKLTNGSVMHISNSFRGGTLNRLHVSEAGKICNEYPKKARELFTGTLQAIHGSNFVAIESTAEGENEFKDRYEKALKVKERIIKGGEKDSKEFYPHFLNWMYDDKFLSNVDMPLTDKQEEYFHELEKILGYAIPQPKRNAWAIKYEELGDYVYQEYPATDEEAFRNRNTGYYYNKLFYLHTEKKGRITKDLYNSDYEVQLAMDLGMNDYNCIGFFQMIENDQMHFLNEYINYNQDIEFYVSKIFDISKNYGYNINWDTLLILPHDAAQKEMTSGITRAEKYRQCGFNNIVILEKSDFMGGVEQVRTQIQQGMWFEEGSTTYIRDSLKKYTKEWDAKTNQFKRKAKENDYYHGADMVRYAVIGADRVTDYIQNREIYSH